ncbi:hypothetical protein [Microbacterium yannicii]|uniref:hypothetical protein n=1 Tax=Microbacterium yannicii TaxID=671622 RepID=UPI0003060D54|nr:hypothetical protein [Microbacterium yannicii]
MSPAASSRAGARRPGSGGKRRPPPSQHNARRARAKNRRTGASRARHLRTATITALATVAVIAVVGVFALVSASVRGFDGCRLDAFAPGEAPAATSRWDAEQLAHASVIMSAGRDLGLSVRDQAIGVMTAMGESSLRNLDYGDWETSGVTNPDGSRTTSIGLFQQQDGWGAREQRLDPYSAATLFYRAMTLAVPESERHATAPTLVAHRTQINADPQHYARYWPLAVDVVEHLSNADTGLDVTTGVQGCRQGPST